MNIVNIFNQIKTIKKYWLKIREPLQLKLSHIPHQVSLFKKKLGMYHVLSFVHNISYYLWPWSKINMLKCKNFIYQKIERKYQICWFVQIWHNYANIITYLTKTIKITIVFLKKNPYWNWFHHKVSKITIRQPDRPVNFGGNVLKPPKF